MRIDSHQHFWRYNSTDYVWMSDAMDSLRRDYLPADLAPLLQDLDFDGSIAVQARQMLVETEWLLDLADANPSILGVVGWVDFASTRSDEQLERLATRPKLRGIRELIHDMPDRNYAVSDEHIRGVSQLQRYGLTYDLLLQPVHLRPALELVRKFPDQPFVVDHLAKPRIAAGELSPWREEITALAQCENVYCKLSGMATEAKWRDWQPRDFRPYFDVVLESFGADRVMIGSDWPVCTLSGSYADVMGIVTNYVDELSIDEKTAILGGSCARFYGLVEEGDIEGIVDCAGNPARLPC